MLQPMLHVQDWEQKNHRYSLQRYHWTATSGSNSPWFNEAENTNDLMLLEVVCPTSGTAFASGEAFLMTHSTNHLHY